MSFKINRCIVCQIQTDNGIYCSICEPSRLPIASDFVKINSVTRVSGAIYLDCINHFLDNVFSAYLEKARKGKCTEGCGAHGPEDFDFTVEEILLMAKKNYERR